ncbi:MAG: cation-translocating P-type ATPase [Candidatus Nealsonbacteria bacterium]|nr:cation-translocating P-type ATPase [Candidatus Nealsonbacteria bacterium]
MIKIFQQFKEFLGKYQLLTIDGALLALLTLFLAVHYLNAYFNFIYHQIDGFILAVLAAFAALPVLKNTFESLKNKKITIDLLASIALIFSLLAHEWASATFINLMLTSARILDRYTENRSRRAIQSLLKLKPEIARIRAGDKIIAIKVKNIKRGDEIMVELGERIPVDGIVIQSEAEVDQSSLTGESLPVNKKAGSRVFSSTVVVSGNLIIKAEKIGKETTLEKMIELVEKAAAHKPAITTMADRFASWYVALMLLGSIALYFATHNFALVLAVVLVVCADDIAVAIPLAFIASLGHAARHGVIIKGGDFLEGLNEAKVIVADKTGTLTVGELRVKNLFAFNEWESKDILKLAATVSSLSNHPSAKAILRYAEERGISLKQPEKLEEKSGRGVTAILNGKMIASGKLAFMKELGIKITEHQIADVEREKDEGFNTTLIGYDGKLAGFFTLADEVRQNARQVIEGLKKSGIEKFVMLTGDNEKVAERVAEELAVTEYHANLLPEDKLNYLKKYLGTEHKVIAIGDGVNDAALLSAADIGIAMGGIGADVTVESGDIVLMQDNLEQILETMRLAKYTRHVTRQDFVIWAITNVIGLSLVFSGLVPAVFLPTTASAYNFITDFIPIINSIRLFQLHLEKYKQ